MPSCDSCSRSAVPYIVHESAMARMERTVRRLWVLILVLIILLVGSNIVWIAYEEQFEDVVTTEIEQETGDGSGSNYVIGGDYHGTAED